MNGHVLDRNKQSRPFDPILLHESIVSACLAVQAHEGEAHSTAERVVRNVIEWLAPKSEVTSSDIRRVTAKYLATYHPEAAYMYQNIEMMV
jgi:transcriptional regulator NrdR family protein